MNQQQHIAVCRPPKLWHGINETILPGCATQDNSSGRPVRSPIAIRAIAIKACRESEPTHPRFKCPACNEWFLLDYGRRARMENLEEYDLHCIDCIDEFHLNIERTGGSKKQSRGAFIEKMAKLREQGVITQRQFDAMAKIK